MNVLVRFVFDNQPLPIGNPKHDRGGADFYRFRPSAILWQVRRRARIKRPQVQPLASITVCVEESS